MTLTISQMELQTQDESVLDPADADLCERMAAVERYWRIQEHDVWMVLRWGRGMFLGEEFGLGDG